MTEMNVSTRHLARGNVVRWSGRVLIVQEIEPTTIPGTNQPGFTVCLTCPKTGRPVKDTVSVQARWTLWKP